MRRIVFGYLLLSLFLVSGGVLARPAGKNTFTLRGHPLSIHFLPGKPPGVAHPSLLFAPGDGGWRGLAIRMADTMASAGYDVYAIDTRQYLVSFTGKSTLTTPLVASDFRAIAQWIQEKESGPVTLAGWSEGAGLALLAAAPPENHETFDGLLVIGLPVKGLLGWRWIDNITYLTKTLPNEPMFSSAGFLPKVAPLPLFMIQASHDEYTSQAEAEELFSKAREPKQFVTVKADGHRFDGNVNGLFQALREGLQWISKSTP